MGRPKGWSRLSVRNWRVRTKFAAVLVVPSLAFGAVGGFELFSSIRTTQNLRAYADRVALGREITELVHPLQQERDRTAGELAGARKAGDTARASQRLLSATERDREAVDDAARKYRAAVDRLSGRIRGTFGTRVRAA